MADLTEQELNQLRRSCHAVLVGHQQSDPAQEFAAMSAYCTLHHIDHDTYGAGELAGQFEQKIAQLTGFEAGAFCVTGTMTQSIALRLACRQHNKPLVAMHASAHILKHENSNFQLFDHFKTVLIGDAQRVWSLADLERITDPIGAVLLELPMREIGGQLPSWSQLEQIKQYCHSKHIHLHLDGARLWEAQAAYGKPLSEICRDADSVYVSFYKGIGALGGAMLLGSQSFVAQARTWMHRQGGRMFRYTPLVVSSAMQFDERLAAMPAYFQRTGQIAQLIRQFPRLRLNPDEPQCNLFHLYLPVSAERAMAIRNRIAAARKIWLFNRASHAALPDQCYIEWYVGDNALSLNDDEITTALALLDAALN